MQSREFSSIEDVAPVVAQRIEELKKKGEPLLVAIDGRSTSGKTTLAQKLAHGIPCSVVHMDHFYLHPAQRTPERYAQPGGNVDYERVIREVLDPWKENGQFAYRPYDAHKDEFGEELTIGPEPVTMVEGTYSEHPVFGDIYDLRVFLTIDPDSQIERVRRRNGEAAVDMFRTKWIPLEEQYFAAYGIKESADLCFNM